jgi:hypothetical protein
MKHFCLLLLFITICNSLLSQEKTNKTTAKWDDLNKAYLVTLDIQNKQVLFTKPFSTLIVESENEIKSVELMEGKNSVSFKTENKKITITLPAENKLIKAKIVYSDSSIITFTIVTAIMDINTEDGEIKFDGETYIIGKYPSIPKSGKTFYFKERYTPPKYFFIWDESLENLPISKNMLYRDLVIKPDAEKPELPRPSRATKVFTLSYETIINFDNIIEVARKKTEFKKVTVLSFYRTPEYNRSIGGSTFSRHIYGDGIDWFIDENPINDEMDDLNKDGKVTKEDGKPFVESIIKLVSDRKIEPCGTGVYFTKKGASLHYDSRGHLARWGASEEWWSDKSLPIWLQEIEKNVKETDEKPKKND